jgi:hypothetical protein
MKHTAPRLIAIAASIAIALLAVTPVGAVPASNPTPGWVTKGLDTYVTALCSNGQVVSDPTDSTAMAANAAMQFKEFSQLGANSVGITMPFYTTYAGTTTSTSYTNLINGFYAKTACTYGGDSIDPTPTLSEFEAVATAAHNAGLRVFIRPVLEILPDLSTTPVVPPSGSCIIFVNSDTGNSQSCSYAPPSTSTTPPPITNKIWHGNVIPMYPADWFNQLYTTLQPYISYINQWSGSSVAIADEFNAMTSSSNTTLLAYWQALASVLQSNQTLQGTPSIAPTSNVSLVITSSWQPGQGGLNLPGVSIGYDNYQSPLPQIDTKNSNDPINTEASTIRHDCPTTTPDPTSSQMQCGWNVEQALKYLPSITGAAIDETEIPAITGSYLCAYNCTSDQIGTTPTPDPTVQANWDAAACADTQSNGSTGIYFWGAVLNQDSGLLLSADGGGSSQLQTETQSSIAACFGGTEPSAMGR